MKTLSLIFLLAVLSGCGGPEDCRTRDLIGAPAEQVEECFGPVASKRTSPMQSTLSVWLYREGTSPVCRIVVNSGVVESITERSGCLPE